MVVPVTLCVSTRLGMKGCLDGCRFRTESGQHVEDDVVVSNANRVIENLHGQMPIAEMPGNPGEMGRPAGPDVDDVFCPCPDSYRAAVAERQPVAVRQCPRFRQVEEKLASGRCLHGNASTMPLVEIKFDNLGIWCGIAGYRMCDESGHDQYRK